uniref:Uncharacterized protein n=1 Tax=Arundo donax TaxID=35708 RepID=A0A0A9HP23_ARUDO
MFIPLVLYIKVHIVFLPQFDSSPQFSLQDWITFIIFCIFNIFVHGLI